MGGQIVATVIPKKKLNGRHKIGAIEEPQSHGVKKSEDEEDKIEAAFRRALNNDVVTQDLKQEPADDEDHDSHEQQHGENYQEHSHSIKSVSRSSSSQKSS